MNMHLGALLNMVRRWRITVPADSHARASDLAASLTAFARDRVVIATAISEPGQVLTRPGTVATRTDGGWRVDGRRRRARLRRGARN